MTHARLKAGSLPATSSGYHFLESPSTHVTKHPRPRGTSIWQGARAWPSSNDGVVHVDYHRDLATTKYPRSSSSTIAPYPEDQHSCRRSISGPSSLASPPAQSNTRLSGWTLTTLSSRDFDSCPVPFACVTCNTTLSHRRKYKPLPPAATSRNSEERN
jgi:hypothetical protein